MKLPQIILSIVLFASLNWFSPHAWAVDPKPIDIVFDLDDTLIRWIRPDEKEPRNAIPFVGKLKGYRYRVLDGTPEIVQNFVNFQKELGVRVSFFSLGELDRNIAVLKGMKLPDGRSAFDIAYKILGKENAVIINGNELKDLRLINPDLSRVLIVDDRFATTILGQEMNVVHILPKPGHFFADVDEKTAGGGTTPKLFVQNRNKLAFGVAIIDQALSKIDQMSPVEALTQIQYQRDPGGVLQYRSELVEDIRFYREGARAFHRANSHYTFTPAFGNEPLRVIRARCDSLLLAE